MAGFASRAARRAMENATLKLLSVGLSVLLFVFVRGDREEEAGLSIPVVAEQDPARVLVSDPIDRLKLKVRGKSSKLRRAMSDDLEPVRIDLTQQTDGEYFFSDDQIALPPGVRVVGIQPPSTVLRFEASVTREVEVEAALTGNHDAAFVLVDRRVEPATVKVRGAKSQVIELKRARTVPIDIGGRWENSVVEVGLKSPGRHVVFDPAVERVRVRLRFEQRAGESEIDAVPLITDGATGYAFTLAPATASIRLEGPLKTLRDLQPTDIEAVVSLDGLDQKPPGTYRRKLTVVNLPKGVHMVRTRPKTVQVTTRSRSAPTPAPAPDQPTEGDKPGGQKG